MTTQDKILALMRLDSGTSARAIGDKIGLTARGVEKSIRKMKEAGIIKRVGSPKGGHWEVNASE